MLAVIFGTLGVVFLFGALTNPFIGLYGFTIFLYLKPGIFSVIFATLHLTRVLGIITFISFIVQRGKRKVSLFQHTQSKILVFLVVAMLFSIFSSIWRSNTLTFWSAFLKVVIAYFLVINLTDSLKRLNLLIWAMILSSVYVAITSIHNYYASGAAMLGQRMFGAFQGALFGDPNDLALSFIMLLPFLYFWLFGKTNILTKLVILASTGIFLWGIVLTQSRGGLLGLVCMFVTLLLQSKRKGMTTAVLLIVLVTGWQFAPQHYKDRMTTIKTAGKVDNAAISRLDAWRAGAKMMVSRPFGVGVGNFGEGFVLYRHFDAVDVMGKRRAAHNMFLQVGGETGVPGFVLFILLLLSALRSLLKNSKLTNKIQEDYYIRLNELSRATFTSLIGYMASGMFLSQGYNFILYYLIGFSVVIHELVHREGRFTKDVKRKR